MCNCTGPRISGTNLTATPNDNFHERLLQALVHTPTAGQERAAVALERLLATPKENATLVLKGYAGTGKTTLVGALVQVLADQRRPVVLLALTGRATKVSDGIPGTNSPFASVMLSYLKDNTDESKLTISKLIDYLKDNVPKFNKQQIPFGTSISGEGELTFKATN
mgnify:CR=1 FL=1